LSTGRGNKPSLIDRGEDGAPDIGGRGGRDIKPSLIDRGEDGAEGLDEEIKRSTSSVEKRLLRAGYDIIDPRGEDGAAVRAGREENDGLELYIPSRLRGWSGAGGGTLMSSGVDLSFIQALHGKDAGVDAELFGFLGEDGVENGSLIQSKRLPLDIVLTLGGKVAITS
jgi:hypothetical protein